MHPSISDQSPSDQRLRSCKLQPTPPAPTAEQCIDRLKERMNARGDRFRSCSTRLRLVSLRPTTAPQMETQRDVGRRRGPDRRQARRSHLRRSGRLRRRLGSSGVRQRGSQGGEPTGQSKAWLDVQQGTGLGQKGLSQRARRSSGPGTSRGISAAPRLGVGDWRGPPPDADAGAGAGEGAKMRSRRSSMRGSCPVKRGKALHATYYYISCIYWG